VAVAHIGHAELRVADLEASKRFYTDIVGLGVTEEDEDHVFLRAWQDWDHHTLQLTRGDRPGVAHVGWRVGSGEELAEAEARLKELGVPFHWIEGGTEPGQGDGLRFLTPAGLPFELYWEVERFVSPPERESRLRSHPERFGMHGISPRRFDHVNFLVDDPALEQAFLSDQLGIRHNYYLTSPTGERLASWLAKTNLSHEIAVMRNREQTGSLLHHVGYYVDSPDQLLRAATILADAGVQIEWGPGSHGTSGAIFLYCFEPSGNRVEVWTGGFLLFPPDWEPIRWDPDVSPLGLEMWGSGMPDSYLRYGTAVAAGVPATQSA
jgi:catechol 2,3-dioxygenase